MNNFKNISISVLILLSFMGCGSSADSAAGYLESGKSLLAEGKPEKARLEFKNAIQVDPKVAESYYQLALLDEKEKNWKLMFSNLLRTEQLDAKHFDAIVKLGQLYLLSDDTALAMEQASKVIKEDAGNSVAWVLKSSVALKKENYVDAMKDVEHALELEPSSNEAISLKAILLNKQGKPKRAIALLLSTLKKEPNALPLTIIMLSILEEQKDYSAMEAVYEDLRTKHASETWVFVSLAKLYNMQGKYAEAKGVLESFVKAQPDSFEAKQLYVALVQSKEPAKALALLDAYIKQNTGGFQLRFAKVSLLIGLEKKPEAIVELKEIVQLDKDSESSNKASVMLANFDMQNNDQDAANLKLDKVLEGDPENEAALLTKARIEMLSQEIDSAVTRLRIILRNNPESEQALVLLAQAYMRSGSTELAEDSFRQALTVNPGNTIAALSVTQGLMKANELDRAEVVLMKALSKAPNNDGFLQALAQVRLLKKDWLGTQSIVDTLFKENKNSVGASYLLARLSQAQENYAEAIDLYKAVLETRPQVIRALQGLAFCSLKLDKRDELLSFLTTFNAKNPLQLAGYAIKSNLYVTEKSYDKAIDVLKEGLALEPKWLGGYSALASVYLSQDNVDKAASAYQDGLAIEPESNRLLMQLASLYEQNKKFSEAKELYERVLERNKDIEPAINNLASLLTDQFSSEENLKKAAALTKRFKSSQEPYYLDTYAWVLVQQGDVDKSLPVLERVVKLAPEVAVFNYHLGAVYAKQKNIEQSTKYLEIAKKLADKQGDKDISEKAAELLANII